MSEVNINVETSTVSENVINNRPLFISKLKLVKIGSVISAIKKLAFRASSRVIGSTGLPAMSDIAVESIEMYVVLIDVNKISSLFISLRSSSVKKNVIWRLLELLVYPPLRVKFV